MTIGPKTTIQEQRITLRIVGLNGKEIYFIVKKTARLRRVFKYYAEIVFMKVADFRFLFDGHRISENDTPEALGLVNKDKIFAIEHVTPLTHDLWLTLR